MQLEYIVREPSEPNSRLSPAIIVFHGYGANEYDLLPVASAISSSAKIISFRAPIELGWGGFAWYNLTQTPQGLRTDTASRLESERIILESLPETIETEKLDPENIIFLGFSQGGGMCYTLIADDRLVQNGITLKAMIVLSGLLPRDIIEPLSQKQLNDLPVFISHGEYDEMIPFIALDEATSVLTKAGANVSAHAYEIGHGVDEDVLADLKKWFSANISWK